MDQNQQQPQSDRFRDVFYLILFVLVIGGVGVLSILVINLRAQMEAVTRSVDGLERQTMTIAAMAAARASAEAAAPAPVASSAWDDALAKLQPCGQLDQDVPDDASLRALGIGRLMDSGYVVVRICYDQVHKHMPFIMAKKELTPPSPDSAPSPSSQMTCVGSCDKVVFGLLHPDTKILKYIESSHHLGIYGEAYDQFCYIDQVLGQAETDDEIILLYCGSGESGGLTHWYQFELKGDKLTEVQTLKDVGPPRTYDVKEPELLEKFIIKGQ